MSDFSQLPPPPSHPQPPWPHQAMTAGAPRADDNRVLAWFTVAALTLGALLPWFAVATEETAYSEADDRMFDSFSSSGVPGFDLWPFIPAGWFMLAVTAAVVFVVWKSTVQSDIPRDKAREYLFAIFGFTAVFLTWTVDYASSSFNEVAASAGEEGVRFVPAFGAWFTVIGAILTFVLALKVNKRPQVPQTPF